MPNRLNALFCSPIVWCAWVSTEMPDEWPKAHKENLSLLNDAIEVTHDAIVTLANCQDSTNLGPFPAPERSGELLTLIECAKELDYFRDLSPAELLVRLNLWLNKLASGVGLSDEESALVQMFFDHLARANAAREATPAPSALPRKPRPFGH